MSVEKKEDDKSRSRRILREFLIYALIILIAIASAALIKVFIFEPFIVHTPSMEPTLKVGDGVIISKLAYKFSSVKRGDIIAFYSPVEEKDLTKRVIAVEGDEITLTGDGEIFINGGKLIENYLPSDQNISYPEQTVIVGENEVFVMGDNRNNSFDSRFFGTISEDDIFGKFLLIYWPPSRWAF
jgi:signal peptidase I